MAKKGYWIAHVNITNPERYKDYVAANGVAFRKYNARFVVRGGRHEIVNGNAAERRHVFHESLALLLQQPLCVFSHFLDEKSHLRLRRLKVRRQPVHREAFRGAGAN